MPIVLQVEESSVEDISIGDRVALTNGNGQIHATLDVSEIYSFDLPKRCQVVVWYNVAKASGRRQVGRGWKQIRFGGGYARRAVGVPITIAMS